MYIQINDKYQLASDRNQWMICTPRKRKNKETGESETYFSPELYFTTLEAAAKELARLDVRLSEATSMAEAMEVQGRIIDELKTALSPDFEVVKNERN